MNKRRLIRKINTRNHVSKYVQRRLLKEVMEADEKDGGYNDGRIDAFESGANWAAQSPELINEILTKYHEWAYNLPAAQFANWDDEEGNKEKTKARIRKEFIEFLNKQNKSQ